MADPIFATGATPVTSVPTVGDAVAAAAFYAQLTLSTLNAMQSIISTMTTSVATEVAQNIVNETLTEDYVRQLVQNAFNDVIAQILARTTLPTTSEVLWNNAGVICIS